MDAAALDALIASTRFDGWKFTTEHDTVNGHLHVRIAMDPPPFDRDDPTRRLDSFDEAFLVPPHWTAWDVTMRLFVGLQFLADHHIRDGLTVNGVRPFESHDTDPPLTGMQHDWFVEQRAALRGY